MGVIRVGRSGAPKALAASGIPIKQYPVATAVEKDLRDLRLESKIVPDPSVSRSTQVDEAPAPEMMPPEAMPFGTAVEKSGEGSDPNWASDGLKDANKEFGWASMGKDSSVRSAQVEPESEVRWFPVSTDASGPGVVLETKSTSQGTVQDRESAQRVGFDSSGRSEAADPGFLKADDSVDIAAYSLLPGVANQGHIRLPRIGTTSEQASLPLLVVTPAPANAGQVDAAEPSPDSNGKTQEPQSRPAPEIENGPNGETPSISADAPLEYSAKRESFHRSEVPISSNQKHGNPAISVQPARLSVVQAASTDTEPRKFRTIAADSNSRHGDKVAPTDAKSATKKAHYSRKPAVGSGNAYSVAYRMKMPVPTVPRGKRDAHFRVANESLFRLMDSDPDFAMSIRHMIPHIDVVRGTDEAPENWVWNHLVSEAGVMELVPYVQHWSKNPLWSLFHPLTGKKNVGGFKLWGHLY